MSRVLIADDDTDLADGLKWYLEAEGLEVYVASDGDTAIESFRRERPDLVILDIMMPGTDGVEVCRTVRAESDVMILMLSARDTEIDKVRTLRLGADDYVTKPFHMSELLARVHALLRRARVSPAVEASRKWEGLELFGDQRRVTVNGNPVELTTMEFDLLDTLMRRTRMVFTREKLVELIWKGNFYGDLRLVDNLVYKLRDKLARAGLPDAPIVTVRGVGYAFRPED